MAPAQTRRRKEAPAAAAPPHDNFEESVPPKMLQKAMRELIDKLVASEDDMGRSRSSLFLELPSREDYPDYYDVIAHPIAIGTIKVRRARDDLARRGRVS